MSADNKPRRVLHIVHQMAHGGIETFLMSMLRCYDRRRFSMDILYTGPKEGDYAPQARALGARVLGLRLKYDQVRFMWRFYRMLRKEPYHAVNMHLSDLGGGAMLAAWLAGVPARVASYHSTLPDMGFWKNLYLRIMRSVILRTATGITTSSPGVTESHFGGMKVDASRIHAITYGCDVDYFATLPQTLIDLKQKGWGPDHVIIGHVGSYRPQKNHEALIKIARRVLDQAPQARFVWCGAASNSPNLSSEYKDRIDTMVEEMGLRPYILQVQGLADMREFYHALDIFVLPSRQEGMPISIIEAQASGRPVVASRINGIVLATAPEMQSNLFEIDAVEPFAACVIDLAKNREKRIRQGLAGQAFARQNLDIRISVDNYQKLYENPSQEKH